MIEVHVFNSLIIPSMKSQQWFSILNFINGLVAPSFLFISGFAFAISANNKLDELRTFGKAFRKKTGRILMILILGYLLHFPVKSVFVEQLKWSSINWLPVFRVDILQCIAAGLFLLFAAMLIIRKDKFQDSIHHHQLLTHMLLPKKVKHRKWFRFCNVNVAESGIRDFSVRTDEK